MTTPQEKWSSKDQLPMKIPVPMTIQSNGTIYIDKKVRDELELIQGSQIYISIDGIKGKE
jgi:hypothetical protein